MAIAGSLGNSMLGNVSGGGAARRGRPESAINLNFVPNDIAITHLKSHLPADHVGSSIASSGDSSILRQRQDGVDLSRRVG